MTKPHLLIQLDPDPHASVFDAVVAADSGVDHLLQYHGVQSEQVQSLVHGAIFTRGPADLHQTAIFVGGTDVTAGEAILDAVTASFFGPMRVSVLMDSNGANTTAAAAVLAAGEHLALRDARAVVLAATGPVGSRVVRLLARQGSQVTVASRQLARAQEVCDDVAQRVEGAQLSPLATSVEGAVEESLEQADLLIAAGAAGIQLVELDAWSRQSRLRVAIDLNAVPPAGIEGIDATARNVMLNQVACYGAIGVGNTKMKIHKAALQSLFQANDRVLNAEEVYAIGQNILGS